MTAASQLAVDQILFVRTVDKERESVATTDKQVVAVSVVEGDWLQVT
jgi:hypothetical protein